MKYAIAIVKENICVGYWVNQVDGIYPSRYISKSRLDLFKNKDEAIEQLKFAAYHCMKIIEPHLPVIIIFQTDSNDKLITESKDILTEWAKQNWPHKPEWIEQIKSMTESITL